MCLSSDSEVSCNTPAVRSQQSCSSLETSPHVHLPPQHHIACFPNHTGTGKAPHFWVSILEKQNILEFVPSYWLVLVSISLKTHEKQCKIQCWFSQQNKTHDFFFLFSTVVGLCLSWNSPFSFRSHITGRERHGDSEREVSSGGDDSVYQSHSDSKCLPEACKASEPRRCVKIVSLDHVGTQHGDSREHGRQELPGEEDMKTLSRQVPCQETESPAWGCWCLESSRQRGKCQDFHCFSISQPNDPTALPIIPDGLHPLSLSLLLKGAGGISFPLRWDSPLDAVEGARFLSPTVSLGQHYSFLFAARKQ